MKMNKHFIIFTLICYYLLQFGVHNCHAQEKTPKLEFEISFPDSIQSAPITGRMFLVLSKKSKIEPRSQVGWWWNTSPLFSIDVSDVKPGEQVIIDESIPGFPISSLKDIPPGKYYIQGLINVYTKFQRSDGHTIWAHMDQWEGQQFNKSPGNLYSEVDSVNLDPLTGCSVKLSLTKVIQPMPKPKDTKWNKHIKIKSKLLSKFWGQPIYLGATVLLPKDYDDYPDVQYPVLYHQGHFFESTFYSFKKEEKFFKTWTSDSISRMVIVHILHPTPYYDDSYAVNSENCGPYGDAIRNELIPYIEQTFRIINKPYARVLYGSSTGGWSSTALQVFHPEFFGGSWSISPDMFDFRYFLLTNIYKDKNAFFIDYGWTKPERPVMRNRHGQVLFTMRKFNQMENVFGSRCRSGQQIDAFFSVFGPVDDDGYPKPLWDKKSGEIDTVVANYYKSHFDIKEYLEKNWSWLGPKLVGKLHFICGDMDNYYLNESLYEFEKFLENTKNPYYDGSFQWGRPRKGHGWLPGKNGRVKLLKIIADYITYNTPTQENSAQWKY